MLIMPTSNNLYLFNLYILKMQMMTMNTVRFTYPEFSMCFVNGKVFWTDKLLKVTGWPGGHKPASSYELLFLFFFPNKFYYTKSMSMKDKSLQHEYLLYTFPV